MKIEFFCKTAARASLCQTRARTPAPEPESGPGTRTGHTTPSVSPTSGLQSGPGPGPEPERCQARASLCPGTRTTDTASQCLRPQRHCECSDHVWHCDTGHISPSSEDLCLAAGTIAGPNTFLKNYTSLRHFWRAKNIFFQKVPKYSSLSLLENNCPL